MGYRQWTAVLVVIVVSHIQTIKSSAYDRRRHLQTITPSAPDHRLPKSSNSLAALDRRLRQLDTETEQAFGVTYIGRGYNLLFGNPEVAGLGQTPPNDATDPGVQANFVFDLTWKSGRTDKSHRFTIPDQINYSPENNCFNVTEQKIIVGAKSYQNKLKSEFDSNQGFSISSLVNAAFSAHRTATNEDEGHTNETKIFLEERYVCTMAKVKYRLDNEAKLLRLDPDFERAVCRLEETYDENTKSDYMRLIDNYGTSIITKATLGTMHIDRSETEKTELFKKAMAASSTAASVEGRYKGMTGSIKLNVDTDSFNDFNSNDFNQNTISWQVGSRADPKPTKLGIMNLDEALDGLFWQETCRIAIDDKKSGKRSSTLRPVRKCCRRLESLRENLRQALEDYPAFKGAIPPEDPELRIPLVWPKGYYGLHATVDGCPEKTNFTWLTGRRYQGTHSRTTWSGGNHFPKGSLSSSGVRQEFCIKSKEQITEYDLDWPSGTYCIYQLNNVCPRGFRGGYIGWDDSGSEDWYDGYLPDGTYDYNTRIQYCCRQDAPHAKQVILPNSKPFYLVRKGNQCQRVKGMTVRTEYMYWDNNDWCMGCPMSEQQGGFHPDNEYWQEDNKLFYCYYQPEKE